MRHLFEGLGVSIDITDFKQEFSDINLHGEPILYCMFQPVGYDLQSRTNCVNNYIDFTESNLYINNRANQMKHSN